MRRRDRVLIGSVVAAFLACRLVAGAETATWVMYPFNGKDLDGWETRGGKQPSLWQVGTAALDPADPGRLVVQEGGNELVNVVPAGVQGADLFSKPRWGDCRIEIEVMVPKGSNSGIYVMGTEIQVLDGLNNRAGPRHNMGAIYGFQPASYFPAQWREGNDHSKEWKAWSKTDDYTACLSKALKPYGQWQKFVIEFELGRTDPVTKSTTPARFRRVELNGVMIHENVPLKKGPRGPDTLMLQGNHGPVAYRNIKITPLDADGKIRP
jgi:hypothetical protein